MGFEQPKKKRGWIWLVVGCGVLLLVGLLGLGGCVALVALSDSDDGVRSGDPVTTSPEAVEGEAAAPVAEGGDEPAADEGAAEEGTAEEDAAEEESSEPATESPASEVGTSRDNPAQPVTDAVAISTNGGTMSVTLGNVNWDANAAIAEANMFNEEAPEGQVYIVVPVTIQYTGPETITPWLELSVAYVAEDGRSYNEASVVVGTDLMNVGDLYDGGTAEGEIPFLIPESAVGTGVFSVEAFLSGGTYFVAAV